MEAPAFLPWFLRSFLNWLFFSLLEEEDDFTQLLRKVAATALFICLPVPFGFGAYFAYQAASGAPKYGPHVVAVFGLVSGALTLVAYIYLRSKRHMSDLFADAVLLYLGFAWITAYFCLPDFDPRTYTGAVAIISSLARPPRLWAILGAYSVLSVVSIYNQVYRDSGKTLLLIPGAIRPGGPVQNLIFQLAPMMILTIAIAGVVAQAAAHVRALAASEAGVRMSNEVVDLLSDYNTDGVDEVLTAYATQGEVNSSLIQSFRGINKNLELYRPHLPNYVLMRDEEPQEQRLAVLSVSHRVDGDSDFGPDRSLKESHRSRTISDSGNPRTRTTADAGNLEDNRRSTSNSDHLGNSLRSFRGRISFARVDLSGMLKNGSVVRDASAAFFDLLFQLAGTFHASVHATIGDVATLSWNATHRVAQPELKAAKFLLRLMTTTRSVPCAHPVSGAVFTGVAVCDVVKATAAKQQAVLISAPWVEALDVAFRLARSARCGLIDAETNATAAYEVEARTVDRVDYVPTDIVELEFGQIGARLMLDETFIAKPEPPTAVSPVTLSRAVLYELVTEVQRDDDEWMYQLQRTATQQTSSAKVTRAFEAVVEGQYGAALSLLSGLSEKSDTTVLVNRLRNRCERMLSEPP